MARLARLKISSDVKIQGISPSARLGAIASARDVARRGSDWQSSVAQNDTTVAFLAELNTRNWEARILTSIQTFLDGQVGCAELVLSPVKSSARGAFGVATGGLVVGDDAVVDHREGRVLVDV